ncbi:hypothetical protein [Funiculus sociatus]|uniref:hypothetical protein n=1 Tax=Funiculus sociatus TaxID=450527 RepID=UPI0032995305
MTKPAEERAFTAMRLFNDCKKVSSYVHQIKNRADLDSLRYDVETGTNLTIFRTESPGVWSMTCYACTPPQSHVFLNQEAFKNFSELTEARKQELTQAVTSFTVLDD